MTDYVFFLPTAKHLLFFVMSVFRFYQELLSSSVLVPFEGIIEGDWGRQDVRHFVAPGGMNTVAKHFLHSAGKNLCDVFSYLLYL